MPICADAAPLKIGDVLVSGRPNYIVGEGGNAYVDKFNPDGTGQEHFTVLPGGHPWDLIQLEGRIIVANLFVLTQIESDGSASIARPVYFDRGASSLAIDATGTIFVGEAAGRGVFKIPRDNEPFSRYDFPVVDPKNPEILALDLNRDQCQMFYASRGNMVQRYDVCTNTPLTDFAVVPGGMIGSIRILADGDVLVGAIDGITRLNGAGEVVRRYVPGTPVMRMSVVPGEDAIWIGTYPRAGPSIEKISLSSGEILVGPTPVVLAGFDGLPPEAILVVGDERAAQTVSIPTLSRLGAFALAVALGIVALLRLVK